ncbi:Holliday junction resolvase RuvX [Erysipelothrix sp. D19-032]
MLGKALGLDFGSKTCGVAMSDALGMYAHPVATLYYKESIDELKAPLEELITKERIKNIALGYPKMMNNDVGDRAQLSKILKTH